MASNLTPISLAAPGFFGLNLQDSPINLPPEFALEAQNCVIDRLGRLGARKGWAQYSDTDAGLGTANVTAVHEFIGVDGVVRVLFICNGKVWEMASDASVTAIYTGTWSSGDDNWKIITFNNKAWFFKRGEDPLVYTPATLPSTGTITKISAAGAYAGTVQTANEVLGAYGRLWTADTATDKVTIKWSDTLIGEAWTGGASGSINLETVLITGARPIVALAAFNGYLVIFCDTEIVVYDGAAVDPATNLTLVEVISGVGCISRDSVQPVGNDIFFLSNTGVRSLGRIIQEKSAPINDISKNVRDTLLTDLVANEDNEDVKSVYNDLEGFYLLTMVNLGKTYYFDLRNRLQDGACRATTWTLAPKCYAMDRQKRMFMGFAAKVGTYTGYYDGDTTPYRFLYKTSHLSGGQDLMPLVKILKSIRVVYFVGGSFDINLSVGVDYGGLPYTEAYTLTATEQQSEYNIAEYNEGEYGDAGGIDISHRQLKFAGQVFQISLDTLMRGSAFSIQQIDFFVKTGRLAR